MRALVCLPRTANDENSAVASLSLIARARYHRQGSITFHETLSLYASPSFLSLVLGTCRRTGDLYHRLLGERYGCNSAHPNVHAEWLNYRNTKSRIDQRVCVNLGPKIHLPRNNKYTENYCQSINLFSHILPACFTAVPSPSTDN